MSVIVIDASALLEYLLGTEAANPVGRILRSRDTDLHAPALCDVEVCAGLRRATMHRAVDSRRAAAAVSDYLDLPLSRHGHQALLPRILELGKNFTAYDACYVALAEHVGGKLLTSDKRLSRAVGTHTGVSVLP